MKNERVFFHNDYDLKKGTVIYWMQRDQRVNDNWALLYAQDLALKLNSKLEVVFCLLPSFLEATIRQYDFMLKGLSEVEQNLKKKNISFTLLTGNAPQEIIKFANKIKAGLLVTDFNPINIVKSWKKEISQNIKIPFHEIDAHNIVPCRKASPKLEFAAYTIRPKINNQLSNYLEPYPTLKKMPLPVSDKTATDWEKVRKKLKINFDVNPADWIKPGEKEASKILKYFLENKLINYNTDRNDPNKNALSNLSPYLHFGQISAQRIALETEPFIEYPESQKSFLEELIVRRELADNFCFYNSNYNSFEGFHEWAQKSLNEHRSDKREYIYSIEQFESAETHDELWNAAQIEMTATGKMHGFMRMYWAKKILEWTPSPEEALNIAIYLNDKYQLDGRDPNGYAGCAWSIGGVHDRAWADRPVFGKIRYMNYNGCKRKFDVKAYSQKFNKYKAPQLNIF